MSSAVILQHFKMKFASMTRCFYNEIHHIQCNKQEFIQGMDLLIEVLPDHQYFQWNRSQWDPPLQPVEPSFLVSRNHTNSLRAPLHYRQSLVPHWNTYIFLVRKLQYSISQKLQNRKQEKKALTNEHFFLIESTLIHSKLFCTTRLTVCPFKTSQSFC